MSTVINGRQEAICTLREISLAGLILQPIRAVPGDATLENSDRVVILLEGFWYELAGTGCSLYRHNKDVIAVVGPAGALLSGWNGMQTRLEQGVWRISGD